MVSRLALSFTLLLGAATAHAESKKLAQARKAIDDVRYDDAQPLLVAAINEGGNTPKELIEIYRLSASTAIVLGQQDVAEQYYRRWLALVPNASLPDSVAPKLRAPFVAAQAYMAAHGRLAAKATVKKDEAIVTVESDPLAMVAQIAIGDGAPKPVGADHTAHFAETTGSITLLDEFGNHLVELSDDLVTREVSTPVKPTKPDEKLESTGAEPAPIPLYRNPIFWGIATLAIGGGGVVMAVQARSADGDVADIVAHPTTHFFDDYQEAKNRRDRDALLANVFLVGGGVCLALAVVSYVTLPGPVAVTPTNGGGQVTMSLRF